jgi:hypothetical protein
VPISTPIPFTVAALASDMSPAAGVTVIYTVTSGSATLACGLPVCSVIAGGDGHATMNVTATSSSWSIVTASLTNGSSLQAQFAGGTPPVLASLTPQLSLAAGATFTWTVQALVLSGGLPAGAQSVAWATSGSGIVPLGSTAALTDSHGVATQTLIAGPLAEGQLATITACLNGTGQCVAFTAFGARPEYASLQAISGNSQRLAVSAAPAPISLRLFDMDGNPMAGGTVALYQALYAFAPPCEPHAVCPPGALLAAQTALATSDLSGSVTFTPATLPGVPTDLLGLAVSGNTATIPIAIEQHP